MSIDYATNGYTAPSALALSDSNAGAFTLEWRPHTVQLVSPRWQELGDYLRRRRLELEKTMGQELTPETLRRMTNRLPANVPSPGTMRNLEKGGALDMKTLLCIPEIYKVGIGELMFVLMPEYGRACEPMADLLASLPWLGQAAQALAEAPESQRQFILDGLRVKIKVPKG